MLSHPFPRVRESVAEALLLCVSADGNLEAEQLLLTTSFMGSITERKPLIEQLQRILMQ